MSKRKTFDDYVLEGGVKGKHFIRGSGSTEGEVYAVVRAAKGHESFVVTGLARNEYFLVEYCYLKHDVEATTEEVKLAREGKLTQKANNPVLINGWGVPITGPMAEKRRALFPQDL